MPWRDTGVPKRGHKLGLLSLFVALLVAQSTAMVAPATVTAGAALIRASQLPPKPQPCSQSQLPASHGDVAALRLPDCLTDYTVLGDGRWAPLNPTVNMDLTITPSSPVIRIGVPITFTLSTGRPECGKKVFDSGCWGGPSIGTPGFLPPEGNVVIEMDKACLTADGQETLICTVTPTNPFDVSPDINAWVIVYAGVGIENGLPDPAEGLGTPGEVAEIAMPLAGAGPDASFTETTTGAGAYQFTSTSTDAKASITSTTWDFGDGSKGQGTVATHTYAKPGTFTVTMTATDSAGNTSQTTQQVIVSAPSLTVSIVIPVQSKSGKAAAQNPQPGDLLQANIDVSAGDGVGDLTNLSFQDNTLLTISPTGSLVIVGGAGTGPPPFTLTPGSNRPFSVSLQAAQAGIASLSTTVAGQDAFGATVTADGQQTVQVGSGLTVSITYAPTTLKIALNNKNNPISQPFAVTVKVTNPFPTEVDNVTLSKNPILTLMGADIAVPVTLDATKLQPNLSLGTLQPGQSAQDIFPFLATTDGQASVAWNVTGSNPTTGAAVKGSGTTTVTVEPAQLVSIALSTNASQGTLVKSGSVATVNGIVTNLTNAQVVNLDPIQPILTGNAGGGNPTDPDSPPPNGSYPLPIAPTLQPGKGQSFTADLQTVQSQGTRATVNYMLTGSVDLADGTTRDLTSDDATYSPAPTDASGGAQEIIHIDDSAPALATASDFTSEVAQFSIGFASGASQWLSSTFQTVAWLLQSAPTAIGVVANAPIQFLQSVDYYVTYWAYLTPPERDQWLTQIAQGILAQTKVLGKTLSAVKATVTNAVTAWMTQLTTAWYAGDYNTVATLTGQVGGNIALEAASWQVHLPEAAKLIKLGDAAKEAGVAKRVSAGLQALEAGDELTEAPGALTSLFGISTPQAEALQELAHEKGLLIAARPRNPLSIAWEALGAVLKPEAIKIKTVSDVDAVFLGYRTADEGSVVFKQPITVTQLKSSAAYQAAPAIEQQAAVTQLASRTKEWATYKGQYMAMAKPLSQGGGISTAFDYAANGAATPANGSVAVKQSFALTQAAGQPPGYYVMYISGHRVTGDIDLVSVTAANGAILTAAQRTDIFDNLQNIIGIQHGDTLSWLNGGELASAPQTGLLSAHVQGGEPLAVFDPTGAARANFIQPQYTFFNTADNAGRIWFVGGFRTPLATAYHFGQLAYPMFTSSVNTILNRLTPAGWLNQLSQPAPTQPTPAPQGAADNSQLTGVLTDATSQPLHAVPSHKLMGACTWQFSRSSIAGVVYPDGTGGLKLWVNGAWEPLDLASCTGNSLPAAGSPWVASHVLELLPQTSLQAYAPAGATHLIINGVDDVYPGADVATTAWFHVGDRMVVDPGGSDQETATISSLSPFTLADPLKYQHSAGSMVAVDTAASTSGSSSAIAGVIGGVLAFLLIGVGTLLVLRRRRSRVPEEK